MDGSTQLSLFPDEKEQAVFAPEKMVTVPEHQRKARRTHDEWISNLTIKEERYEEEHPVCEKCSAEMVEVGEEKAYDELVYVPGEFYVRLSAGERLHIQKKNNGIFLSLSFTVLFHSLHLVTLQRCPVWLQF